VPKPNAIIDFITDVGGAPTPDAYATGAAAPRSVSFQSGRSVLLDPSKPQSAVWAEVLEELRASQQPVYIEVDPATNVVTRVLGPITVRVGALKPLPDGSAIEVELVISHARHYLRRSNPDFSSLYAALQEARQAGSMVAVIEGEGHEIIAVKPVAGPLAEAAVVGVPPPVVMGPPSVVSAAQAMQMFNMVASQTCCPQTTPVPCIPFLYPDDGCWGRAHEMCRLMIASGIQPEKVWIFGSLHPASQNNPGCSVGWGWHVAPTLRVSTGGGGWDSQVIDPSLMTGPVTQAAWKAVQNDPAAALVPSSADIFYRNQSGSISQTDPTYTQTNSVLATYRMQLRLRATGPSGPPPYPSCIPARPNVQFVGTLNPNETHRWFTWGWPPNWHVYWTLMPLTPCPGAPQIKWRIQLERANPTQCTYWIVATNLTGSTIRFEARYDILQR
jgi:hypothetical protein